MAISGNDIQILITAVNEASATLVQVQVDAQAASRSMQEGFAGAESSGKSLIGTLGEMVAAMALFAGVAIGVHDVWDEMSALSSAAAQTNAVLKSTGDAAGVTAQQVGELAGALEKQSTYSKAAIQDGENILLTFKNIGGSILPQTTKAVMDMSTAMHMDLNSAALQVGKALEDPIGGLTRLQRAGVTFTDQQKEMIKQLVESGQGMKAQQIILDELASEFGGSATAQTQTFSGELTKLKNEALTGIAEFMNSDVLPRLLDLVNVIQNQIIPNIQAWIDTDLLPKLKEIGDYLTSTFGPTFQAIGDFFDQHKDMLTDFAVALGIATVALTAGGVAAGVFGAAIAILSSPITIAIVALAAIGTAIYEVITHWDELTAKFPAIGALWSWLQGEIDAFRAWVTGTLLPNLQTAWDQITSDVATLVQGISDHWNQISNIIGTVMDIINHVQLATWDAIKGEVTAALDIIQGIISTVTDAIHGNWSQAWTDIENTAKSIWQDIVDTAQNILGDIESVIADIWNNVGSTTVDGWNAIVGAVETGVNAVIGLINDMTGAISGALSSLASIKTPGFDLPSIPGTSIGGGHVGGIAPFAALSGIDIAKIPNVSGGKATFSPIGGSGPKSNATPESIMAGLEGGNLQGAPKPSSGTETAASLPGGGDTTLPDMSGAGAGDFALPKGAGGGKGAKPPAPPSAATDQQDLTKVWKDLHDAGDLYAKTLAGIKDDQPKVTQALLDSEKAMRPELVDAMTAAYQNYQAAAGALAADVAGGASTKQLQLDNANLSDAKDRFNAAAKDVTDLDTKINADTKTLHTERIKDVDEMGKAIEDALKAQAQQQLQTQEDTITAEKQFLSDSLTTQKATFDAEKKAADDKNASDEQGAKDSLAKQYETIKNGLADQYQAIKDGLAKQDEAKKQSISDQEAAQIAATDADTKRQVAAIQAQIDAPAIKARTDKENQLRAEGPKGQAELNQMLIEDHNKTLEAQIKQIEDAGKKKDEATKKQAEEQQKAQADAYKAQVQVAADANKQETQFAADANKQQLQDITNHYADLKKASDQHFEDLKAGADLFEKDQVRSLDTELAGYKQHFKDITSASALEDQARLLLEKGNQDDIINLLHSYNPDWQAAGVSLGQQMIDGIKQTGLPEYVASLFAPGGALAGGSTASGPAGGTTPLDYGPGVGAGAQAVRAALAAANGPSGGSFTSGMSPVAMQTYSGSGVLSPSQIASLLLAAGATPDEAITLTAIAMGESGGNPGNVSSSVPGIAQGGAEGLFQFMPATAAGVGLANPYDPAQSAAAALRLARSMGYTQWDAYDYNSAYQYVGPGAGTYTGFLGQAQAAVAGMSRGSYSSAGGPSNIPSSASSGGGMITLVINPVDYPELARQLDLTLKRMGQKGLVS